MSSCIADVATIVFSIGNVTVRSIVVCTVAGSFAASLQLTNNCMAPVSNIAAIVNPWVWTNKYNGLHCTFTLLNYGSSTFPAYLMPTSYISFPAPSWGSCRYYFTLPSYYLMVASSRVFASCVVAYMGFWTIFSNMSYLPTIITHWSLLLTNIL